MGRFKEHDEFEDRFPEKMTLDELRMWKGYWTQHAQFLQPKIRKVAMKRVYKIDRAIAARLSE